MMPPMPQQYAPADPYGYHAQTPPRPFLLHEQSPPTGPGGYPAPAAYHSPQHHRMGEIGNGGWGL